jgi:2-methylcitrate dehydratase PrpD
MAPVGHTRFGGNHVKEGIPAATATGIASVDLAESGFTGPLDLLDHATYDAGTLLDGLGVRWMIEGVYFKPYSCCRWAHAAIDGALALQATHGLAADEIAQIDIETFDRALRLGNDAAPRTIEAAQYSVPFCVALAIVRGPDVLLPMLDSALADRDAIALARRIRLRCDPALDAMFSAAVPARVAIHTRGTRFETTVTAPRGEPSNPMSLDDLVRKLRVATRALDPALADRAVAAIHALDRGDLAPLLAVVGTSRIGATKPAEAAAS